MAITPIEALNKVVEERVARTALRAFPLLNALYEQGRMKTKTDTNINWDAEVSLGTAAIEAITADGAATTTGDTVLANLRIGRYRIKHQFSVNRVDLAEAATRAPGELANLFNEYVDRGLVTIFRTLNNLLYTGDGAAASAEIAGINKILDSTYAYAGINTTTNPIWKSITLGNAGVGRSLTKNLLLDFDEQVGINEVTYNTIVAHPSISKKYNQLFDTIGASMVVVNTAADSPKKVELAAGKRTYNGYEILEDPVAPTTSLLFLNTLDVDLYTFKLSETPSASQGQWAVMGTEAYGMNIMVAELPSMNSAKRTFEIYVLPQFRFFNRKSLQAILDIA